MGFLLSHDTFLPHISLMPFLNLKKARKRECPICKRNFLWINGFPPKWFCWGSKENPHEEWSETIDITYYTHDKT